MPKDLFSPEQQKALALASARKREAEATGPWTAYQQQALDELNRRRAERKSGVIEGPWTKFQARQPRDLFAANGASRLDRGHNNVPEFVPVGVDGYDPETGLVDRSSRPLAHDDALSEIRTASGGFIEGIPIVGPLIRGGVDRAAAGTLSLFSDQSYDDILRTIQEGTVEEKAANPILDTGSQIAGSVAGTVPMIMAAPAAFGANGGGVLARTMASTATGSALGGVDAAVRSGGDPDAIERGIYWGGGTGLAGPVAGDAIGASLRAATNLFRPSAVPEIPRHAARAFSRAAIDDGLDASTAAARMQQLGPDAMPLDLGPNLTRQAGALAAEPGEAQRIIRGSIGARDAGANSRITSAMDEALGPAGVPSRIDDALRSDQGTLSPLYQEALRGARRVDTEPIANMLDSAVVNLRGEAQAAAQRVRQMLNVNGANVLDPNPATLLSTRQAIDDMLAHPNMGANTARLLGDVRRQVDEVLADSVPGIKAIDARFAELARQRDGLQRGGQVFATGKEAVRPSELSQEMADGALPQGMMIGPSAVPLRLREGARAELDRIVGTRANDRVALQRLIAGEGDWNAQKLATLFGPDRATRILQVLDAERVFAESSNVITRNSETAARLAAQREFAPAAKNGISARDLTMLSGFAGGGWGAAAAAGSKLLDKGITAVRGARQSAHNKAMAEMLTGANLKDVDPITAIARVLMENDVRRQIPEKTMKIVRALMQGTPATQSDSLPAPTLPFPR